MSIQPKPLVTNKVTTVSNISTTARFPVERSSAGTPPPQTRPPQTPRPQPTIVAGVSQGVSKAMTPMRIELEALAAQRRPGTRAAPMRPLRPAVYTGGHDDPPEGVGSGQPPAGGVKVR